MNNDSQASLRARERLRARAAEQKKALEAQQQSLKQEEEALKKKQAQVSSQIALIDTVSGAYDDDLQLALLLSLTSFENEPKPQQPQPLAPLPVMPDTKGLSLADRKAVEESATADVLGDVQQYVLASTLHPGKQTVTIGSRTYRRVECGASHGGHTNLCGYLSLTMAKGPEAVELKGRIAPVANRFSAKIGAHTDFTGPATLADLDVIRAYVLSERTPVCVFSEVAGVATTYRNDACVHDCVYLYLQPGHFQRLVPV